MEVQENNMDELNQAFIEYVNEFKKISTKEKRQELISSIKDFIAAIELLARNDGIKLHYLQKIEVDDLNKEKVSEDDFLEALIVYIEVAKNMLGEYLNSKE